MLGGGGGGLLLVPPYCCWGGEGRGSKKSAPQFPGPQGEPAHGLHPRFVVAEIWADREEGGLRGRRRRHQTTRIPSSVDDSPAEIFSINDSVSSVQSQCRGAWHSGGPAHEKHTHAPCRTPPHTAQGEGLSGCAHVITCLDCTPGTAEHRTTSTTPPQHLHGA